MPLFGLPYVIVVFLDHIHLLLLLLVKLYIRQTDGKPGAAVQCRKSRYCNKVRRIDDAIAKFVFDKCVEKNGYVYFPDNTDIE